MKHFEVDMTVDYKAMGCEKPSKAPKLITYILDQNHLELSCWKSRPAVIICPGGAYAHVSPREAEPIALSYNAAGCHAFVLDYSVAPTGWPAACCELSKAVAYVRSIADEYAIDKEKIVVCGFSAGGNLAASIAVHYDKEIVKTFSGVTGEENKPNGLILAYPVITDEDAKTHMGTKNNFIAGNKDAEQYFGMEHHVNENTPKTFLWHTFSDGAVPVESSMRFASALRANGVPFEMHIFPEGPHGLSLANKLTATGDETIVPAVQPWMEMSITWLNNL